MLTTHSEGAASLGPHEAERGTSLQAQADGCLLLEDPERRGGGREGDK